MRRTLLITLDYPPMIGGVAYYYSNLVKHLPSEAVSVLHNNEGQLLFDSFWIWPKWLKGLWSVYKCIKHDRIEYLLVGQVLPLGTMALIWHGLIKIPFIVMTHAMDVTLPWGPHGPWRKKWLCKKIYQHAAYVTTVSKYTQQELIQQGVPAKKIILLPPAPTISARDLTDISLAQKYHLPPEQRVILSVSRLVKRKGIDFVIKVIAKLKKKFSNIIYVIIGTGDAGTELHALVDLLQLNAYVKFIGNVGKAELAAWYERCEMLVMPTRVLDNRDVEGFGIVFLEAGNFKKPVIGGLTGGVGDAVIDGQTGLLVEPDNEHMLQAAMERLLTDKIYAKKLGQNSFQRIQNEFCWEISATKLANFLN